jgi:NAD(P)H-hydrate repair Nnr-like enzyme with NAD(P)H-hydrate epimerase domain
MSEEGGFTIDQLMELAGLSVSQAGQSFLVSNMSRLLTSRQCTKSTRLHRAKKS